MTHASDYLPTYLVTHQQERLFFQTMNAVMAMIRIRSTYLTTILCCPLCQ